MPHEIDGRRFLRWGALLILLAVIAFGIDRDARTRAQQSSDVVQRRIEQHICVVLIPLLPKAPDEIPTTGYGIRVVTGVKQGAQLNHCVTPPLPKRHH